MKRITFFLIYIFTIPYCFSQQDTTAVISGIYTLGEVVISESGDRSTVTAEEMEKYNSTNTASSLKILPSIVLGTFASRNESTVYVRGFDIRSVPVFIDGIPVYVPYDGYVDLGRFTVSDISRIDVSKGFAPAGYGANTLGGAINLVSKRPSHGMEIRAFTGIMSGKGLNSGINLGSRRGKFYIQAGLSYLGKEYVPLSMSFQTSTYEPDHRLDNSGTRDAKFSIKLGYVPGSKSEYSINYIYSHSSKESPVYLGNDPNVRSRYWEWPYWDKQSIYYISQTGFGDKYRLKLRAYFDSFRNELRSFDDGGHTTQSRNYSFNSFYDDYTVGGNLEFSSDVFRNNQLLFSAHFKNDNHSEHYNIEPVRHFADNTWSAGIEDIYRITSKLKIIPSVTYNFRQDLRAEDYDAGNRLVSDFPDNNSKSLNAQLAAYLGLSKSSWLNAFIAYKSRFATMKDRYSYRLGTGIPNPDLKPEDAINLGLSYKYSRPKLSVQPEIFYSNLFNTIQLVNYSEYDLTQMQNTGESVFSGADISADYSPFSFLDLYAAYSFIKRKNLSNPGILFTDVPEHRVFASAEVNIGTKLKVILSGEYNSRRISSTDGSRRVPGYALGNVRISYEFLNYLQGEAGVNNIMDTNYALQEGYPEAGRNFYITLRFNIEK
ncbi:MAG TPA: TonB-dependent receptor [Bacteroidales bacterium]|nr:TonB-dependent receptor [Bacteroidales bacterium]